MALYNIGLKAVELLNKQIKDGVDMDGKRYEYSDRPFWMPYSKKLAAKFGKKSKAFETVKSGEKLGMIILGGYESVRKINNRATDDDYLQWSGEMLSAMTVIRSTAFEAVIGFNSPLAAKKAFWLNYSGVGKSRKLWKFFGLTKENFEELTKYAGDEITIDENLNIKYK